MEIYANNFTVFCKQTNNPCSSLNFLEIRNITATLIQFEYDIITFVPP